jgi:hypothetical protein
MTRSIFQYHPTFGFHYIPGVKARVPHESGGYLVRANAAGFRSEREFVAPRVHGLRRALLFGDSYTAGDGVSNGARYSDVLEKLVPEVEIYNYGLPGTGTDQHYLVYREVAGSVEHDLVIIAVLVENIRRVVARHRVFENAAGEHVALAKPYFSLEEGRLTLHHVPVPRGEVVPEALADEERRHLDVGGDHALARRVLNLLGPTFKSLVQGAIGQNPVPAYDSPSDAAWQLLRAILVQWIGESKMPVLLVPLPLYHHVEEIADASAYQTRFAEVARDTGARLHDPLPDLRALSAADRRALRFERDVHPTPLAHEQLARSLAPAIMAALDMKAPAHV